MPGEQSDGTKQKTFHGRVQGTNVSRVAQDLGLDPSVLRRWVGQMRGGTWEPAPGKPLKNAQQQEIEQLRRELAKVKTERDILKKAVGYFAKDQT